MGGGLMQLVAYGAQDIYLTGNPQITFFKVVYRRHTNFSMECIQQTINGASQLSGSATSTGTVTVSRNGDLVSKVWVRCNQDNTNGVSGDKLIQDVEVEIGGQKIDKHNEEWLQLWAELTTPESKTEGYKYLSGGFTNDLIPSTTATTSTDQQSIMVPLQFWFCRNPGLALPLIALQYHEVKLKFTWNSTNSKARDDGNYTSQPTCEVWCDYIYLDTDERRRFAQVSHEYLIEQLQRQTEGSANTDYKLNFNHPVKELIWTNTSTNITTQKAKLVLNGHDRFASQDREYFQIRQPLEYHTAVPGYNIKELERPRLLSKPIDSGITSESNTAAGLTAVTMTTTTLTYENAPSPPEITNINAIWRIGDVFVSDIEKASASATVSGGMTHTVTTFVASATSTSAVVTFTPALEAAPTSGDAMQVFIIARHQDPLSRCSQLARDVNVYSFALKPEEHQPSGTCNFSRIDNAKLNFDASATVEEIYAVNYNVLRIMSGMGGLAYSN
jgi:hypothetical protein